MPEHLSPRWKTSIPLVTAFSAHIGHFWSLCVEEQFYLIWPIIVWRVRDRVALIRIAAGLSLAAFALRAASIFLLPPEYYERVIVHLIPFRMDSLLIGAILALVLRGPSADAWQRSSMWLFILSGAAVVAISSASPVQTSRWMVSTGLSMLALASAGLIGVALRPGAPAFRFLCLRPLRTLGRYSYGFYIYHLIFPGAWWHLASLLTRRLGSSLLANFLCFVANFAVTFLVSALSYNLFEYRFLRLKHHFEYDAELTEHKHALAT